MAHWNMIQVKYFISAIFWRIEFGGEVKGHEAFDLSMPSKVIFDLSVNGQRLFDLVIFDFVLLHDHVT